MVLSSPALTEGFSACRFRRYAWGVVARPRRTFDALAAERSVGYAVLIAALGVFQVWGNMAIFALFGHNWLGSLPLLADPTYVGGFGYLSISPGDWLPIFMALMPGLALYGLVVPSGVVQLLSKLWGGRGSFEQMVNVLAFATVPSLAIGWASEWLTGVPLNLVSGSPYFYGSAMQGEYGTAMAALWTAYATAVYTIPWGWGFVLGIIGIRRIQGIPWPAAVFAMLLAFAMSMLITTTFVR